MKRRVVVMTNQKGGVGKTTLTRELGFAFAKMGVCVLLVDADAQGNLSKSVVEPPDSEVGLAEALDDGFTAPVYTVQLGLYLLAGNRGLSIFERRVMAELDCYTRLKALLAKPEYRKYELVLIDTPPSLGLMTINALAAADCLVIPMNPAQYTMQGTNELLATVAKAQATLNPELEFVGVILNAVDPVPAIVREIVAEIRRNFESKCFESFISKSIRIEEAIAQRKGLVEFSGAAWKRSRLEVEHVASELAVRLWGESHERRE